MLNITANQCRDYQVNSYIQDTLQQTVQPALGAIVTSKTTAVDAILDELVTQLQNEGYHLSGLRQRVLPTSGNGCGVRLQDINTGTYHRITQDLGTGSTSCNIDIGAVEQLAMAQCDALDDSVELVIVNRFGKRESEGGGFCTVIEKAVDLGIPVLTVVKQDWLSAWLAYGGECVSTIRPNKKEIEDWCKRVLPFIES